MTLIYYHIEKDILFESAYLDGFFFALAAGVNWDKILILGEL